METALDQLALWDLVTWRADLTPEAVLAVAATAYTRISSAALDAVGAYRGESCKALHRDLRRLRPDIADNLDNGAPVAGIAIYVMNADGGGVTRISGSDVQGQAFPDGWRP